MTTGPAPITGKDWQNHVEPRIMAEDLRALEQGIKQALEGGGGGGVYTPPPAPTLPLAGRRAVSYGDSNTYLNGYQPVVAAALGLTEYVNRGHDGGRMAGGSISSKIQSYTDHDTFDIVTIWASGGDFTVGNAIGELGDWTPESYDSTTTFLGGYRRALDHILADNPAARIILVTITNRLGKDHPFTNTAGNTLDDYNDAIKAVGELYALPVCDMNSLAGINEKTLSTFTYDGLHFSAAGFERAGLVLANFIAQHAGLGPDDPPPPETDTTAPTWTATLTTGTPTSSAVAVTASALANDNSGTVTYELSHNGSTWTPISPVGTVFTISGLTESTTYSSTQLRAKDPSGNTSNPLSVPAFTTDAAPVVVSPGDFDFLQSATLPENATSGPHTFAAQNLGAEAADRIIVVVVSTFTGLPAAVSGVTIGGVEATLDVAAAAVATDKPCLAVARASVPNGTTGDVVISYSDMGTSRASIGLYRVTGASLSVVDTDASPVVSGVAGGTLAVQAGGVAVVASGAAGAASGATATWEGVTNTWVHAEFAAQGGGYAPIASNDPAWAYSATWSKGNSRLAAAVSYAWA